VANSLLFLEYLNEEFPFPAQRIQSDRGQEFFGYKFQEKLMEYAIKFRPNKPASPHLNGKVERSQKTDLEEFWSLVTNAANYLTNVANYLEAMLSVHFYRIGCGIR
jgi:transposase InsO family protein